MNGSDTTHIAALITDSTFGDTYTFIICEADVMPIGNDDEGNEVFGAMSSDRVIDVIDTTIPLARSLKDGSVYLPSCWTVIGEATTADTATYYCLKPAPGYEPEPYRETTS